MRPAPLLLRCIAAAALAMPVSVLAEPVGFAVGNGGPGFGGSALLYRIDLATGQSTLAGPLGYVDVEGAALAPDGHLYAVADLGLAGCEGAACGTSDLLLRVDQGTGAATVVGPMGLAGQGTLPGGNLDYGLAATCSGQLWLSADTTGQLWEVDRSTGATRLVGNTGVALSGLAAWGDLLFGVSVAPDPGLYRIDTATAVATRIGALGLPLPFYDAGLDFDAAGQLWATIDYFTPPGGELPPAQRNDVARVDLASGAAVLVAQVTGAGSGIETVQMEGLAIAGGAGCGVRPPSAVPVGRLVALVMGAALLLAGLLRLRPA